MQSNGSSTNRSFNNGSIGCQQWLLGEEVHGSARLASIRV
jgi:hypothetical protein